MYCVGNARNITVVDLPNGGLVWIPNDTIRVLASNLENNRGETSWLIVYRRYCSVLDWSLILRQIWVIEETTVSFIEFCVGWNSCSANRLYHWCCLYTTTMTVIIPSIYGDHTAKNSSVNYKTWILLMTFLPDEWITSEHIFGGRFFELIIWCLNRLPSSHNVLGGNNFSCEDRIWSQHNNCSHTHTT